MTKTTISKKIAVIITAAGSSTRMGGSTKKEYLPLGKGTVLSNCVDAFVSTFNENQNQFELSHLVITVPENGASNAFEAVNAFYEFNPSIQEKVHFINGGKTRQISVYNAMQHLQNDKQKPDIVLIHDGARPFVTNRIIVDVIKTACSTGAAIPVIPVTDTIKEVSEKGIVVKHLVRKTLAAVQTPQGFDFSKLMLAHEKASHDNREYTDDAEIFGAYGGQVQIVAGDIKNIKITYQGDLERGTGL